MLSASEYTEAQQATAKPWIAGMFSAWLVGIACFAATGYYLYVSNEPNLYLMTAAIFGTSITVRIVEWFCLRKLSGISLDDPPQTKRLLRRLGVEIVALGSFLAILWWGLH